MSASQPLRGGEDYEAAAREMGVDLAWAVREFPVPVYFRGSGRVFLLRWSKSSVGSHLIVARSPKALDDRAHALIDRYRGDVRFREGWLAEVVGPSPGMSARYALDAVEREARLFWGHVAWHLQDNPRGILPPLVAACPYEAEEGSGLDAEADLEHFSCALCGGMRFAATVPLVPLYVALRGPYEASVARLAASDGSQRPAPYGGGPSRAEPADDAQPPWGAFADHGHHARGTFLAPADRELTPLARPLFFFHPIGPIDVAPLNREAARRSTEASRSAAAEAAEARRRSEAVQAAHRAELVAMLKAYADQTALAPGRTSGPP